MNLHNVRLVAIERICSTIIRIGISTRFNAKKVPSLPIRGYIERFNLYLKCEEAIYVAALIYIDRVVKRNPEFLVTSRNVHRLVLTCVMVADKFLSDGFLRNTDYALVGGISNDEINQLEHELIHLLDFNLYIEEEKFATYQDRLQSFIIANLKKQRQENPREMVAPPEQGEEVGVSAAQ